MKKEICKLCETVFRCIRKTATSNNKLRHVCLYACLSTRNNLAPTAWIFV